MEVRNLTAKIKSMQKQNQVDQLIDQLRKMKQAVTRKHNIEIGLKTNCVILNRKDMYPTKDKKIILK